jgi:hypothetical protein
MPGVRRIPLRLLPLLALILGLAGCATTRGVPVDARPTPAATTPRAGTPAAARPGQPSEPSATDTRDALRTRVVADTTAARRTATRCLRATLLPEQEASLESLRELLRRARVALLGQDLARAESLARQARQMASALDCGD